MSEEIPTPGDDEAQIYRRMDNNAEALAAIDLVVNAAHNELRIFDASPRTLRERGFASPARIEVLRKLLLADRAHRLRIALHETRAIEAELPRLIDLLASFAGQLQIHRTLGQATEARDPLIVADDCHFWRRLHIDQPRSVLTMNHAVDTRPFIERFEEIWEKSEPAVSGSTLGL